MINIFNTNDILEKFFRTLPLHTLRAKFLFITIPLMFLALGSVLIIYAYLSYQESIDNLYNKLNLIFQTEEHELAGYLDSKQSAAELHPQYQHLLHRILSDPNVVQAKIFDLNDNLVETATTNDSNFNSQPINLATDDFIYKTKSIYALRGKNLVEVGTLQVIMTDQHQVQLIAKRLLLDIYLSMFSVLIMVLGALVINRYTIDNPLTKLLTSIELTKSTNTLHPVEWQTKDEFGKLVAAFNDMQLQINQQTANLTIAKEEAEAANHTKSDFLANMSHELRTPLHSIIGFSKIGIKKSDSWDPEKHKANLTTIQASGEHLLGLVNSLLDLSKLEAGKMQFEKSTVDIREVINNITKEITPLIDNKKLKLSVTYNTKNTNAYFDQTRIGQVLRNLLSNAIKFTPEGKNIVIAVADEQDKLSIAVIDQGIGIPVQELDVVFDKFMQSSTTSCASGGTGLGLSICKEIILAHDGSISARNNPTGGATFTVILPRNADV